MHLYTINRHFWIAITLSILSVISWQFIACTKKEFKEKRSPIVENKIGEPKSNDSIFTEEVDYWTDTIIGPLYVRIHNRITTHGSPSPDDPLVWDGPVEIGKSPGNFSCKIDTLWIIENLNAGPSLSQISIKSYSGSNTRIDVVDVDSCKIINARIY